VTGTRTPLIAGNWKMNLHHLEAIALVQKLAFTLTDADLDRAEVVVLPPFTDLRSVQTLVDGDKYRIGYGAQDVSPFSHGAYTGDISAGMLAKLGCSYVCAGHSERREQHGDSDQVVSAKANAAIAAGIAPIVCVGEGLAIRQAGSHVAHTVEQLNGSLAGVPAAKAADLVIAYEPVWAIGTGEVATPDDAQEVCSALRSRIAGLYSADVADTVRVLYGGSVKPSNIAGIMACPDVDGALVGGASLEADTFVSICRLGG
jgi:triosephosphate isomerase (TIM)